MKLRVRQVQLRAPREIHLDRSMLAHALRAALLDLGETSLPPNIEQLFIRLDGANGMAMEDIRSALRHAFLDAAESQEVRT